MCIRDSAFGVPLFHRGKNRIELTDTGEVAVEQARSLLSEAEKAVETVPVSYTHLKWPRSCTCKTDCR